MPQPPKPKLQNRQRIPRAQTQTKLSFPPLRTHRTPNWMMQRASPSLRRQAKQPKPHSPRFTQSQQTDLTTSRLAMTRRQLQREEAEAAEVAASPVAAP